ncbi:MAG TPA: hypothetical protein VFG69_00010 [Nannocystaceae bacterium]|nr:hypothetical protein [Nannocystaceae bacterium]
MSRLIAAFACAFVMLFAATASAQDRHGNVTFDLQAEGGELPTHLCVVSEARSARARDSLWDLLEAEAKSSTDKPSPAGGGRSWRVRPKAWSGLDDSAEHQRCAAGPIGDCRPHVELQSSLTPKDDFFVACTADSANEGGVVGDPRPLFVLLEHHEASPPQIETIRLAGGVATVGVAADVHHGRITARIIGGGYLADQRAEIGVREESESTRGSEVRSVLIVLTVTPLCRVVELTLPRTTLHPTDRERLRVRAHGVDLDVDKCVGPLLGTEVLQVRLPKAPLGVGHIDVELGGARKNRPTAQFGGRYEGAWPKPPFALQFKQVTFTWKPPKCIYPADRCPSATLENGTVCAPTVTSSGCEYRCPGEVDDAASDIVLPLAVTFEKEEPTQRWTDKLARSGQTLTSYVPADEIYLNANVNDWTTDVPDNTIRGVEIYGEDGTAHYYGVTPLETRKPTAADQGVVEGDMPVRPRAFRLPVPGASCEPIRYKPVGDRTYEEREAQVKNGNLEFREEWRAVRRVGFNVTLAAGGGPAFSTYREPGASSQVYFSGLGMFALEIRPKQPKFARLAVELRFGGTLGRYALTEQPAEDDDSQSDAPQRTVPPDLAAESQTRASGWARILAEPGLVVSAHQRVSVGFGFGLGMALPFRTNENLLGDRLRFIYSPNIDLRFRVRKWLKLVLQFRGVLNEQPFKQGNPFRPEGVKTEDWSGSFITLFGVQASF